MRRNVDACADPKVHEEKEKEKTPSVDNKDQETQTDPYFPLRSSSTRASYEILPAHTVVFCNSLYPTATHPSLVVFVSTPFSRHMKCLPISR